MFTNEHKYLKEVNYNRKTEELGFLRYQKSLIILFVISDMLKVYTNHCYLFFFYFRLFYVQASHEK